MFITPAFAEGKVSVLKEGQRAPFDGYLFDPVAFATIEADKEAIIKKCELDKDYLIKKCDGECKFINDTCKLEKETIEKTFKVQLDSKSQEIDRLNKLLIETKTNKGLWFGLGAAAGIVVSLTTVYLVKKI
jgi:hypothetical protein